MQARRTVPTVFSIYMLDVLCCALGCVILLWQVNYQEAEQQTAAAKEAERRAKEEEQHAREAELRWKRAAFAVEAVTGEAATLKQALEQALQKNELLTADLARTRGERDDARRLVALREQDYEKLRQAMQLSEAMLKNVRAERDKAKEQQKLTAAELAGKVRANAELLLQASAAEKKVGELEKDVAARKLDAAEAAKRLQEQFARLARAEDKNKMLETRLAGLKTESKEAVTKLSLNELRIKVLEQDLERYKKDAEEGGERVRDLQADHDRLSKLLAAGAKALAAAKATASALQDEADRRFAGVALTGQRVIFLVDMSGSMERTDIQTLDPDKWPLVCETVVRIMQSIAGLRQYQVILFSDQVRYPLGGTGRWLDYDAKTTPKTVLSTLKAITPEGETNLYAAFAEAFRYRDAGLDTVYVLSDGLPTAGAGLPANSQKLSDNEKTDLLTRHLRGKLKTEWNRPLPSRDRVRINTIGFFFESPDVGAFLWALAREHDGSFVGMSK